MSDERRGGFEGIASDNAAGCVTIALFLTLFLTLAHTLALALSKPEVGSHGTSHQPTAGYVAVPRTIDVQEDEALMIQIIEYLGG